jgi:hypothetical protein
VVTGPVCRRVGRSYHVGLRGLGAVVSVDHMCGNVACVPECRVSVGTTALPPLRRLSQYTAPILLFFPRHWTLSRHVHI